MSDTVPVFALSSKGTRTEAGDASTTEEGGLVVRLTLLPLDGRLYADGPMPLLALEWKAHELFLGPWKLAEVAACRRGWIWRLVGPGIEGPRPEATEHEAKEACFKACIIHMSRKKT